MAITNHQHLSIRRIFMLFFLCSIIFLSGCAKQKPETIIIRPTQPDNGQDASDTVQQTEEPIPLVEVKPWQKFTTFEYPNIVFDFDEYYSENKDFKGWFYFEALDISYPFVMETYDDQYLHTDFYGKHSAAGTIFIDEYSLPGLLGAHDMIFGHNMRDGSMFAKMNWLYRKGVDWGSEVINENPYLYFYLKDRVIRYRIFSFYRTDNNDGPSFSVIEDEEDYFTFIENAMKRNEYEYEEELDLSYMQPIITASTCRGARPGGIEKFNVNAVFDGMMLYSSKQ